MRLVVLARRQWRAVRDWVGMPERFHDHAFDTIFHRIPHADGLAEHHSAFFAPAARTS